MFIQVDPSAPKPSVTCSPTDPRYAMRWDARRDVDTVVSVQVDSTVGLWVHPDWRPIDATLPAMRSDDV